jgi:hyperosmotically inducible periplasmic protein
VTVRKIVVLIAALIAAGAGYYIYNHGWRKPESIGSVFSQSGDPATTRKVKTALSLSKRLAGFDINVSSNSGIVTLEGHLPSEDAKSLAGEIARDTAGVTDVKNEIAVDPATQPSSESSHVEDLEIRVALLDALNHSRELAGRSIDAKVENRVVTLSGSVETPAQKNGADQIARAVDGVAGVTNNLTVTNPQAATEPPPPSTGPIDPNADLEKRVEFELFRTGAFNTQTLQIKADQGAVKLAGTVRTRAEQLLAERIVEGVPGVKKVSNELKIAVPKAGV